MKIFNLAVCLSFAILAFPMPARGIPPPEIRVLVIDTALAIKVDGGKSTLKLKPALRKKEIRLGNEVTISATSTELLAEGRPVGKEIALSNREGEYKIADRSFGGTLSIIWKSPERLMVVDRLPVERYLIGLVGSEISAAWPVESIKAQVVAARTYALDKIDEAKRSGLRSPYDITSTISSQVYHGSHVEDSKSAEAVLATRGEVLYRNGSLFPSYYHSCCGGRTEHAHNVWDGETGPPVVDDKFCLRSPKYGWSFTIPTSKFAARLRDSGYNVGKVLSVATTTFSDSPRVQLLLVEGENGLEMIEGRELRKIFGYTEIKSTWFEASLRGSKIDFKGRGYGHGVGMCQWGAKGMAEAGHSYRDILKFYYSDAEIGKAY